MELIKYKRRGGLKVNNMYNPKAKYYFSLDYSLENNQIQNGDILNKIVDEYKQCNILWTEDTRFPIAIAIVNRNITIAKILRRYMRIILSLLYNHATIKEMEKFYLIPIVFFPSDLLFKSFESEQILREDNLKPIKHTIITSKGRRNSHDGYDIWISRIDLARVLNKKPEDLKAIDGLEYLIKKGKLEDVQYY